MNEPTELIRSVIVNYAVTNDDLWNERRISGTDFEFSLRRTGAIVGILRVEENEDGFVMSAISVTGRTIAVETNGVPRATIEENDSDGLIKRALAQISENWEIVHGEPPEFPFPIDLHV